MQRACHVNAGIAPSIVRRVAKWTGSPRNNTKEINWKVSPQLR